MNHDLAFVQSILEAPDDLTLRQVYADWLEERGDVRAQLIRSWLALLQESGEFWRGLRSGIAAQAEFRRFRSAVTQYQQLLRQVDPEWVHQIGRRRAWISRELALNIGRVSLRVHGFWQQPWRWIVKDALEELERGWLVPFTPDSIPQWTRQRSWLAIHKYYATVTEVGPQGPIAAVESLEINWAESRHW